MAQSQEVLESNLNQFFLIVIGCMIFFMQCGFAFLEAGSVRAKNTTNILIKNTLDIFVGAIVYWLFGYAIAFGGSGDGVEDSGESFIGNANFGLSGLESANYAWWFFQFVFAATASTIVSGAMAERTEFTAYLVYSIFITGFVYPVVTHWAWSEHGWLTNALSDDGIKYQDFAGSGVVHMVGGLLALVGAAIVGPRLGRFDNENSGVFHGHTVPLVSLGGFILFFGFLAFNGGSQGAITGEGDGDAVALAIVNTVISGAGGAIMSLVIKRGMTGFFNGHWSFLTTVNGGLTGMVAICAGCNVVYPWAAFIIGLIAGAVYMIYSYSMERIQVDDPLDAVAVHFGGGCWGIVAVTLFNRDTGVFYKWDKLAFQSFGWNILGGLVISAWSIFWGLITFGSLKALKILRVPNDIEIKGLDIAKHGEPAYPQASYGDGWGVEPERTVGQTGLVLQTNCAADASSNIETVSKSNIEIVS